MSSDADTTPRPPETSKKSKRKHEKPEYDPSKTKHVYVSGLPSNITQDEFTELMSKYGIIATNSEGKPILKLYTDESGTPKGDGRCCYARKESVDLATNMLDGYLYDEKHTLKCERAQFQEKASQQEPSKRPKLNDTNKFKKIRQKVNDKLLSWEPDPSLEQKKVVLKHMFSPEEIDADDELMVDIKDDVESRCHSLGLAPSRVDLFDRHPEGVITVTFKSPEEARECVRNLDKQFYGGRTVSAELWDGETRYKSAEA